MKINNKQIKSLFLLSLTGSNLAKEENSTNQTEITSDGVSLNSLPEMGTNFTSAQITQEGSVQNIYTAGTPALFSSRAISGVVRNKCTGGFVAVNANSSECNYSGGNDYGGFLTSVFCFPSPAGVPMPVTSWDGSVTLGKFGCSYSHRGSPIDFNYISNNMFKLTPLVPKTTDEGKTDLLPVVASASPTILGTSVCVYGAASGYRCGNLTETNVFLTVPDPYIPNNPVWRFNDLGKVDLGTNGLLSEDIGAPVYIETQVGEHTLAEALGHVSLIDNNDAQHQSFYYTPVELSLLAIKFDYNCTYSLLTYNETNSQEYDQLLAQVEIPAKN